MFLDGCDCLLREAAIADNPNPTRMYTITMLDSEGHK
jgi:hypothetical protein